jgi:hypothetical protein
MSIEEKLKAMPEHIRNIILHRPITEYTKSIMLAVDSHRCDTIDLDTIIFTFRFAETYYEEPSEYRFSLQEVLELIGYISDIIERDRYGNFKLS